MLRDVALFVKHITYYYIFCWRFYIFTHKVCMKIIREVHWAIKIFLYLSCDKYHIQYLLTFGIVTKPKANLIRRSFVFFPFFLAATLLYAIGLVFFTSFPVHPTLSPSRLLLSRLSLTLNSRGGRERMVALLSRAAANLMTPRIIVRLLTGEKWPFTCGRI